MPRMDGFEFAQTLHERLGDAGPPVSPGQKRLQQVFFPDGIRFDGKRLVGTGTTLPGFNYLRPVSKDKKIWWTIPGSNR
jgi:hypothetical protein